MVMLFSHSKVRKFLLENGFVYTFRYINKDTMDGKRKQIGKDWANSGRCTKKIADIIVTPIVFINVLNMAIELSKYVRYSGFYKRYRRVDDAVREWIKAINTLRPKEPTQGWIYKVTIISKTWTKKEIIDFIKKLEVENRNG